MYIITYILFLYFRLYVLKVDHLQTTYGYIINIYTAYIYKIYMYRGI